MYDDDDDDDDDVGSLVYCTLKWNVVLNVSIVLSCCDIIWHSVTVH